MTTPEDDDSVVRLTESGAWLYPVELDDLREEFHVDRDRVEWVARGLSLPTDRSSLSELWAALRAYRSGYRDFTDQRP